MKIRVGTHEYVDSEKFKRIFVPEGIKIALAGLPQTDSINTYYIPRQSDAKHGSDDYVVEVKRVTGKKEYFIIDYIT